MKVQVNGRDVDVAEDATVADAVRAVDAPRTGVAVALDGAVVPRGAWASTALREGAALEVLTAVQGG